MDWSRECKAARDFCAITDKHSQTRRAAVAIRYTPFYSLHITSDDSKDGAHFCSYNGRLLEFHQTDLTDRPTSMHDYVISYGPLGYVPPPPTLCKIRLTIIAITHKYTKITITRKASRPKEGREEGREWCLRHASKYIFGLVWPYSLTFCTQFVVSQRAFTIMCACQVWLNFVAQFFSHLAEMDFWLTIFRPIMVLTFDPQTPKLAISCTCFVDDCVNLYQNRFIRFQNITYNGWLDKIE